jgi:hypothetical protein
MSERKHGKEYSEAMQKRDFYGGLLIGLIVIGIIAPLVLYYGYRLPAEVEYNQWFGGYLNLASVDPSLQGTADQIHIVLQNINIVFGLAIANHEIVYDSPFYWDFYYKHSLAWTEEYYNGVLQNIAAVQAQYDAMIENHTVVQGKGTWYSEAVQTIHASYLSECGMCENQHSNQLYNAFFLYKYPFAWWFGWIGWSTMTVVGTLGICCIALCIKYDDVCENIKDHER